MLPEGAWAPAMQAPGQLAATTAWPMTGVAFAQLQVPAWAQAHACLRAGRSAAALALVRGAGSALAPALVLPLAADVLSRERLVRVLAVPV